MEWARSCHKGTWRLFQGRPDILTRGRYVFAPEGTPYYEGWHNYGSADWTFDAKGLQEGPELGEVRALRAGYDRGALPGPFPVGPAIGDSDCIASGEVRAPDPARQMILGFDARCYVVRPVAPPLTPFIWLRPETFGPASTGDPVASWTDSGLADLPAKQALAMFRPTIRNPGLNGLADVEFLGARSLRWDNGSGDGGVPFPSGYTAFVVGTESATGGALQYGPWLAGGAPSATPSLLHAITGTMTYQDEAQTLTSTTTEALGTACIWYARRRPGSLLMTRSPDQGTEQSALGGTIVLQQLAAAIIGVPTIRRKTFISEVIVFDGPLDDATIGWVLNYLRTKYGLP